jgi:hypothetical protein
MEKKKFLWFSFIMFFLVLASIFAGYLTISVGSRAVRLYRYVKSPEGRGWEGTVHKADDMLGFSPIPLSSGFEILPDGKTVMEVVYDKFGCRVPDADYDEAFRGKSSGPSFLFLGCSFTFGSACPAEKTFPFLVANSTGGTAVNAGVISYGFAQMILRARELIPQVKPDFVVIQSSPWLIFRSTSMFRPTRYGKIPVPYITRNKGGYAIAPPVYRTNIFDIPIRDFMETEKSFLDMVKFYFRVALPFFLYTDFQDMYVGIRTFLGKVPKPVGREDMVAIERYVYSEIGALCSENRANMVILSLYFNEKIYPEPVDIRDDKVLIVFADEALNLESSRSEESYNMLFKHVSPDTGDLVDFHPNSKAHRIIADSLYNSLRKWAVERQR